MLVRWTSNFQTVILFSPVIFIDTCYIYRKMDLSVCLIDYTINIFYNVLDKVVGICMYHYSNTSFSISTKWRGSVEITKILMLYSRTSNNFLSDYTCKYEMTFKKVTAQKRVFAHSDFDANPFAISIL